MIGKKEIAIVMVTKASCTMWRENAVALTPNLRITAAVAATLQATATLVLILCQMTASKVMQITLMLTRLNVTKPTMIQD
eukprot:504370-Ditylum_brightwellii.AAC.1